MYFLCSVDDAEFTEKRTAHFIIYNVYKKRELRTNY